MKKSLASIALVPLAAATVALSGCAVAPGYYDYDYAQPYYPGYGYAYGPPYVPAYVPAYGSVGIWGGWGGSCCYHGGGHWHGDHGDHGGWHGWHGGPGGWHGGGHGGTWQGGGARGGGGGHGGGHGH